MFKPNRKEPTNFSNLWKPSLMCIKINTNIIEILFHFAGDDVNNLGTQICAQRRMAPSLDVCVHPRYMLG